VALPTSYLTSTKNLEAILNAIQGAQAPETFTQAFLSSLEFKSSSDRLIIGVLKSLGFLDEGGKPKDRYFRFLDQGQSAQVLAEGVREAYSDLFKINTKANELTRQDVINKFRTLSQGQLTDSVLDKMASTFIALVKVADFTGPTAPSAEKKEKFVEPEGRDDSTEKGERKYEALKLGGLVYNIELVLPESRDPAVYDALFHSLRRHLL
jgi:hypothetical protein